MLCIISKILYSAYKNSSLEKIFIIFQYDIEQHIRKHFTKFQRVLCMQFGELWKQTQPLQVFRIRNCFENLSCLLTAGCVLKFFTGFCRLGITYCHSDIIIENLIGVSWFHPKRQKPVKNFKTHPAVSKHERFSKQFRIRKTWSGWVCCQSSPNCMQRTRWNLLMCFRICCSMLYWNIMKKISREMFLYAEYNILDFHIIHNINLLHFAHW